jgi:hypothetical protein
VKPWKETEAEKETVARKDMMVEWKMRASYRQAYRQLGLSPSRRWNSKQFLSLCLIIFISIALSRSVSGLFPLTFTILLFYLSKSITRQHTFLCYSYYLTCPTWLLNGQCHEIFASGFFHESVSPKPLIIPRGPFQIFSKIREDIRSSRCTTHSRKKPEAKNLVTLSL